MRLYNYSALSDEDDKIYSIGGTKISSTGISMASIKVIGPFFAWYYFFSSVFLQVNNFGILSAMISMNIF